MEMFEPFTKEGIMPKPHNGRLISQEESDSIRQNIKDVKERKEDYPLATQWYEEIERSLRTKEAQKEIHKKMYEEYTDLNNEEGMNLYKLDYDELKKYY